MEDAARITTSCIQLKVEEEGKSEPTSDWLWKGVRKETVSESSFECGGRLKAASNSSDLYETFYWTVSCSPRVRALP